MARLYFGMLVLLGGCLASLSNNLFAEDVVSQSEIERFFVLKPADQKKELVRVFRERIEFAKNLFYRSEIRNEAFHNNNGQVGDRVPGPPARRNYAHWQLNNDYRYDTEYFDPAKDTVVQWSTTCWDSKEGVCRNFVKNEGLDRIFGRVDTVTNSGILMNDQYSFWLVGGSSETFPLPHYLFPHLLSCQENWDIIVPFEDKKVQLVAPYDAKEKFEGATSGTGKITLVLDPKLGFMPVRGIIRSDVLLGNGRNIWREERFEVQESHLVSNTWMPVLLKSYVRSSVSRNGRFAGTTTKVSDMRQGAVAKSDVVMVFPEGAEITDAIDGIGYHIDANGNPVQGTIQPLYGLDPSQVKMPQPKSKIRPVLIVIGLALIFTALYMKYQERRKK